MYIHSIVRGTEHLVVECCVCCVLLSTGISTRGTHTNPLLVPCPMLLLLPLRTIGTNPSGLKVAFIVQFVVMYLACLQVPFVEKAQLTRFSHESTQSDQSAMAPAGRNDPSRGSARG